ncbi:CIC11C00000000106 [Sungouiella intermedia]|uniref:Glycine cleavage system H protein n=1 Tax=Sungouiella intermedia TaxID=45354 RepID=A0A1L0CUZ5_9ASCO|nr:CIC11C00000000106 [[Candida] intermedia]SGZ49210.1 CIC11C00000003323 [[Candida] intermedia]
MFRTLARQTLRGPAFRCAVRFNSVNFKLNTDSFAYKYLEEGPKFVKFTQEHEWLAVFKDDTAFVGITTYASEALGDTTFVELPEVGVTYEAGELIGSVESVKSASEIYSPVAGEVIAINDILESKPQLINDDPMGSGWIAQIKLAQSADEVFANEELLEVDQYEQTLEEH